MAKGKNQTYYELKERFEETGERAEKQGCPVCRLTLEGVARFLNLLSNENVNDFDLREQLRAAFGFCTRHTWQWHSLKNASGTAIIYQDIARNLTRRIRSGDFPPTGEKNSRGFLDRLRNTSGRPNTKNGTPGMQRREDLGLGRCLGCAEQSLIEQRVLEEFIGGLSEEAFRQAYQKSNGICLPHLSLAGEAVSDPNLRQFLLKTETHIWDRIEQELGVTIEKFNFDKAKGKQELGEETRAIGRAIWKSAGNEGMA